MKIRFWSMIDWISGAPSLLPRASNNAVFDQCIWEGACSRSWSDWGIQSLVTCIPSKFVVLFSERVQKVGKCRVARLIWRGIGINRLQSYEVLLFLGSGINRLDSNRNLGGIAKVTGNGARLSTS